MNPGFHRVAVFRDGRQIAEETLTLTEGGRNDVSVEIPVAAPVAQAVPTTAVPTAAETAAAGEAMVATTDPLQDGVEERGGHGVLVGVLVGVVVVAGLAVGGYFLFRGDDEAPFQSSLGTVDFR